MSTLTRMHRYNVGKKKKITLHGFKQGSDLFSELLQRCAHNHATASLHVHVHGRSLRVLPLRVPLCRTSYIFKHACDPASMHPLSKRNLPPQPRETFFKHYHKSCRAAAQQRSPASCCAKAGSELSDGLSQHLIEFGVSTQLPGS